MIAAHFVHQYRLSTLVVVATAIANLFVYLGRALP